jgi:CheY-like chemotaxis protein
MSRSLGPNIDVQLEMQAHSTRAIADMDQLELAILNLVINARDAMKDGGSLRIGTRVQSSLTNGLTPGRYVVISISDTGAGIPEHLQEKVFEPFFTTKPLGKGTGLGLSQVYGISQQCGGTTYLTSKPGEGTKVEIWLPVADAVADVKNVERADEPLINSVYREKVLLIEDDRDVRRFICECLDSLGYQVSIAGDGKSGLELLEKVTPDLLIVDFAMPGMNGAQVANEVRSRELGIPIVFVTGYADMDAIEGVQGCKFVLRKPFEVSGLATVVREALETISTH